MSATDPRQERPRSVEDLAAGYTRGYAWVNRAGVVAATVLALAWGDSLLAAAPAGAWPWIVVVTLLGVLTADLLTGFVHWASDTWGTVEMPLLGTTLIRTFREHHLDPQSITRHDWAEINGEACLAASPVLGGLLWGFPTTGAWFYAGWWLGVLITSAMFTNQLHKWAHMPASRPEGGKRTAPTATQDPPVVARWLQRGRVALTPAAHRRHHTRPFVQSYCITTGWMNPVLDATGFWRTLERWISAATGAVPREDDLGHAAAVEVQALLRPPRPRPGPV